MCEYFVFITAEYENFSLHVYMYLWKDVHGRILDEGHHLRCKTINTFFTTPYVMSLLFLKLDGIRLR